MPPRPSSPRISYLPALVAVTILLPRTDVRRLTMHVLAVLCRGQCSLGTSVSQSPRAELGIAAVGQAKKGMLQNRRPQLAGCPHAARLSGIRARGDAGEGSRGLHRRV